MERRKGISLYFERLGQESNRDLKTLDQHCAASLTREVKEGFVSLEEVNLIVHTLRTTAHFLKSTKQIVAFCAAVTATCTSGAIPLDAPLTPPISLFYSTSNSSFLKIFQQSDSQTVKSTAEHNFAIEALCDSVCSVCISVLTLTRDAESVFRAVCSALLSLIAPDRAQLLGKTAQDCGDLSPVIVSSDPVALHSDSLVQVLETLLILYCGSKGQIANSLCKTTLSKIVSLLSASLENTAREQGQKNLVETDVAKILGLLASDSWIGENPDPIKSRVVALTLALQLIVNGGPAFRNSSLVLAAIKTEIVPSLMKSCASPDTEVFRLSLGCFLGLWASMRGHLVLEMKAFFDHVLFGVLSSQNAPEQQKKVSLDCLAKLAEEPRNLIDMFLTYDCDPQSSGIYEALIVHLTMLAGGSTSPVEEAEFEVIPRHKRSHSAGDVAVVSQREMKTKALRCFLLVAYANVQWIERFEDDFGQVQRNEEQPSRTVAEEVFVDDDYTKHFKSKKQLQHALFLFNVQKDPDGCFTFLAKHGLEEPQASDENIENDDEARLIAEFLFEHEEQIDRIILGEYFSKLRKPKNKNVFLCWVKSHRFSGLTLDEALRLFLGGFKLVGEAQIVDQSMEIFAQHYFSQNPQSFSSATTAFVLAFSICMLNTDAHSDHITTKMSKAEFISNNREIDEGKDLPAEVLEGIYQRITANEIVLRPNACTKSYSSQPEKVGGVLRNIPLLKHIAPVAAAVTDAVLTPMEMAGDKLFNTQRKKKDANYRKELSATLALALETIRQDHEKEYVSASRFQHAIPMWECSVDGLVSSFCCSLEESGELFDVALEGMISACKVCASYGFEKQTEFMIRSLAQHTHIKDIIQIDPATLLPKVRRLILEQNVKCLKSLVETSFSNAASLSSKAWSSVFGVLSLVEALIQFPILSPTNSTSRWTLFGTNSEEAEQTQRRGDTLKIIRGIFDVDSWLTKAYDTSDFSPATQVKMASALSEICTTEIKAQRTFSLRKLSEIIRVSISLSPRMLWREQWSKASPIFVVAGVHVVETVALEAVEALRMLAFSFLKKEELANFGFQKELMKPFEEILKLNPSPNIRGKIVEALFQVVELRSQSMASGWSVVFSVLSHAAALPSIVVVGWALCEHIVLDQLAHLGDVFREFMFCLSSFACNSANEQIAVRAVSLLGACGLWLTKGLLSLGLEPGFSDYDVMDALRSSTFLSNSPTKMKRVALCQNVQLCLKLGEIKHRLVAVDAADLWMALLDGVVPIIVSHVSIRVRFQAIVVFCSLLLQYGRAFDFETMWLALIEDVIRPIATSLCCESPNDPLSGHVLSWSLFLGLTKVDFSLQSEPLSQVLFLMWRGLAPKLSSGTYLLFITALRFYVQRFDQNVVVQCDALCSIQHFLENEWGITKNVEDLFLGGETHKTQSNVSNEVGKLVLSLASFEHTKEIGAASLFLCTEICSVVSQECKSWCLERLACGSSAELQHIMLFCRCSLAAEREFADVESDVVQMQKNVVERFAAFTNCKSFESVGEEPAFFDYCLAVVCLIEATTLLAKHAVGKAVAKETASLSVKLFSSLPSIFEQRLTATMWRRAKTVLSCGSWEESINSEECAFIIPVWEKWVLLSLENT